jgi:hypothetical protein
MRSARDWGASIPLLLTNHRLVAPVDPSGSELAVIELTGIKEVRLRKPPLGFAIVTVDYGHQQRASFPVHFNAQQVVADISAAREAARPAAQEDDGRPSGVRAGDRYERLRKLGELRASGVLTESEFQEEKARILAER